MSTETKEQTNAKFCTKCGTKAIDGDLFCAECGAKIRQYEVTTNAQVIVQHEDQTNPQVAVAPSTVQKDVQQSDRVAFAIMCMISNAIGVPCFMRGRVLFGILRIVLMCATFGIFGLVNTIAGIKWGIRILRMSEEEYNSKKDTFGRGIAGI